MEVKSLISIKIMDIVKNLENNIQNKPTSTDNKVKSKNKEILLSNVGFINLINNQKISKF